MKILYFGDPPESNTGFSYINRKVKDMLEARSHDVLFANKMMTVPSNLQYDQHGRIKSGTYTMNETKDSSVIS